MTRVTSFLAEGQSADIYFSFNVIFTKYFSLTLNIALLYYKNDCYFVYCFQLETKFGDSVLHKDAIGICHRSNQNLACLFAFVKILVVWKQVRNGFPVFIESPRDYPRGKCQS